MSLFFREIHPKRDTSLVREPSTTKEHLKCSFIFCCFMFDVIYASMNCVSRHENLVCNIVFTGSHSLAYNILTCGCCSRNQWILLGTICTWIFVFISLCRGAYLITICFFVPQTFSVYSFNRVYHGSRGWCDIHVLQEESAAPFPAG
jgi:hypothetical protein